MADKQQQKAVRPLKPLLNAVYEVHRKDIKAYTSGHLNPGKLLKRDQERHLPWETSTRPPIRSGFYTFQFFKRFKNCLSGD